MRDTSVIDKIYLADLDELKQLADRLPNTRMMALGKVTALVMLNMRYERIMTDRTLPVHPYELVRDLVRDALRFLAGWAETAFIEQAGAPVLSRTALALEQRHQKLFQTLWVRFSLEDYEEHVNRYVHRLRANGLGRGWLDGKRCIDFGCGHGNFSLAMLREGAASVYGLDYGEASVAYAAAARDRMGIAASQVAFKVESVYEVSQPDASFDFAVQNGVFHHLEHEDAALREVQRVLKPGGWFWYYTDGSGGISYDLWDASVHILRDVPEDLTLDYLASLNISTNKKYHLGDGLHAHYRRSTWAEAAERLARFGFGNWRRLIGGFPTDFDHDVIAQDRYGREKFGEGDLRILAQKLS